MTTPALRTWSRMSSRERSSLASPPIEMIFGLAISGLAHKRVRRPWPRTFDAAAAFPRVGKALEDLLQLGLLGATDQKRCLPFEIGTPAADLPCLLDGGGRNLLHRD